MLGIKAEKITDGLSNIPRQTAGPPSKLKREQAYLEAESWLKQFEPKDDACYGWVNNYAEGYYGRLREDFYFLDAKADGYLRYFGVFSAIGLLLSLYQPSDIFGNVVASVAIILGVILSAISFGLIVSSRTPDWIQLTPSIKHAVEYAECGKSRPHEMFLAEWHLAAESLRMALARKAKRIRRATYWFYSAWLSVACAILALANDAGTWAKVFGD